MKYKHTRIIDKKLFPIFANTSLLPRHCCVIAPKKRCWFAHVPCDFNCFVLLPKPVSWPVDYLLHLFWCLCVLFIDREPTELLEDFLNEKFDHLEIHNVLSALPLHICFSIVSRRFRLFLWRGSLQLWRRGSTQGRLSGKLSSGTCHGWCCWYLPLL